MYLKDGIKRQKRKQSNQSLYKEGKGAILELDSSLFRRDSQCKERMSVLGKYRYIVTLLVLIPLLLIACALQVLGEEYGDE